MAMVYLIVPIFLSNSLLKNCTEVAFLDCDIGQTEFTPPGLVSLSILPTRDIILLCYILQIL